MQPVVHGNKNHVMGHEIVGRKICRRAWHKTEDSSWDKYQHGFWWIFLALVLEKKILNLRKLLEFSDFSLYCQCLNQGFVQNFLTFSRKFNLQLRSEKNIEKIFKILGNFLNFILNKFFELLLKSEWWYKLCNLNQVRQLGQYHWTELLTKKLRNFAQYKMLSQMKELFKNFEN